MLYGYTAKLDPRTTVLYLDNLLAVKRDCRELRTVSEVKAMITETGADKVMFGLYTLPRRAVEVSHPKLDQYIRTMVKACNR